MAIGRLAINWKGTTESIATSEIKILKAMNPGLPEVQIELMPSDGNPRKLSKYSPTKKKIVLFWESIANCAGKNLDRFEELVKSTLAHEFQHHYQFHGSRKEYFIQCTRKEKENNVDYWDQVIEKDAKAAAHWFVERTKSITVYL